MALSKKQIAYLDSLSDECFLAYLWINYGERVPKWEECSREEYIKYNGTYGIERDVLTDEDIQMMIKNFVNNRQYKCEPIYKDFHGGILNWIKLQDKKPDGYRFYKLVASEPTLMLGRDMFDYCQTRECMKEYFITRQQ